MSSKKSSVNEDFASCRNCFASLSSKKGERTRPLDSHLTSAWKRRCWCCGSMLSHKRRKQSGVQRSTANFIYNFHSAIQYFVQFRRHFFCRQVLSVNYTVSSQHLFVSNFFYFSNHTGTTTSHICSSVRAYSDAFTPVQAMFKRVLIKRPEYLWTGGSTRQVKATKKFFLEINFFISHETKQNGTVTHVSSFVKLNSKIYRFLDPLHNLVFSILCHVYNSPLNRVIRKRDILKFSGCFRTQNLFTCSCTMQGFISSSPIANVFFVLDIWRAIKYDALRETFRLLSAFSFQVFHFSFHWAVFQNRPVAHLPKTCVEFKWRSSLQGFITSFERTLEHTKHKGSGNCSLQGATVNPNFKNFWLYCLTNFPFRFLLTPAPFKILGNSPFTACCEVVAVPSCLLNEMALDLLYLINTYYFPSY